MIEKSKRRATLASVVIGLWLGGLAFLGKKELFRPHMDKLADAGLRVAPGASYYAVLQQGQQIGFASSTIDTTDGGISVHDYLVADVPVAGKSRRATARTEVNLTRKLRVTHFKMQIDAGLVPIDASGRWSATRCCCSSCAARRLRRTRITSGCPGRCCSRRCCLSRSHSEIDRRPGARLTLPMFDPIAMAPRDVHLAVQAESVFVVPDSSVFDAGALAVDGRATRHGSRLAHLHRFDERRTGFTGWVDESGRIVLATQLLGMSLERRPYEVAFENWKADAANAAPPYRRTATSTRHRRSRRTSGCATNIGALRLRLTGADLSGFDVKGFRQRLKGDTLTITREGPEALAREVSAPRRRGSAR